MKITHIIAAGLTATLLSTGMPYAQTEAQVVIKNEMVAQMEDVIALVEALKAEGYTYIEIRRTMLGRAKIIAQGPDGDREIVLSTTTGEVMRDATHGTEHMGMGDGNHDDTEDHSGGMDEANHGDSMDEANHGDSMDEANHGDSMDEANHGDSMDEENHGGGMGGNTSGGMGGN